MARAIQAYEDTSGKYEPTKVELWSLNSDKALDSLEEKLVFSKAMNQGHLQYMMTKSSLLKSTVES